MAKHPGRHYGQPKTAERIKQVVIAAVVAVIAASGSYLTAWISHDARIRQKEADLATEIAKSAGVASAIVELSTAGALYSLPAAFVTTLKASAEEQHRVSLPRDSTPDDIQALADTGWRLFLLGSNSQAIRIYQDCINALRDAKPSKVFDDVAIDVHKRFGQVLRKVDSSKALEHLGIACKATADRRDCHPDTIAEVVGKPDLSAERRTQLAEVLNDIALVHRAGTKENLQLSQTYYELSDAIVTRLPRESDGFVQHGWNQNGLGIISLRRFYATRNRDYLVKARQNFTKAEEVFRLYTGSSPRGAAINHLALVDHLDGQHERAAERLRMVVRIWKDEIGPLSPDVELTYSHLSETYAALSMTRDRQGGERAQSESSEWSRKAAKVEKARARGLDIRLDRHGAVYSADGRDEWKVAVGSLPTRP